MMTPAPVPPSPAQRLAQKEHRLDVDAEKRVELLFRHPLELPIHGNAGIVHQHVQAAEQPQRLLGEPLDLLHVGEVGVIGFGLSAGLADLVHGGAGALAAAGVVQDDCGALAGELQRHPAANPRSRPGYQHSLAAHVCAIVGHDLSSRCR